MTSPGDESEHDESADDAAPSVVEGEDQPLGVDPDKPAPERGPEAMPGIPTEGEPPASA